MSCVSGCIKWLLFLFNFMFAVCGLGILTVGILVHLQLSNVTDRLDISIAFPSITLMVLGGIIFIIAFFGCCGAIRESHCMTITFASLLLFILLIQVAVAVYAFVVVKNTDNHINIEEGYTQVFEKYYTNEENKQLVDVIQAGFQCCGVNSESDFNRHGNFNGTIPFSCCGKQEGEECSKDESYKKGCAKEISKALMFAGSVLGGVAIGIAAVELVGIIFALCLANSIRNTERRGYRV
ncbi:PREDICTED: CD63 antigen-like isoform X2 [Dufourea novaeangliae]|uniref:CD63 antigen-like isoform X2 n=1 Tax=Dufourea novaeangliae TaxID=178035 RepID=UPI000767AA7D|nr:PREDICTED: CD63 antigen-like isoform X2 [Dufourea novaeangliae]